MDLSVRTPQYAYEPILTRQQYYPTLAQRARTWRLAALVLFFSRSS